MNYCAIFDLDETVIQSKSMIAALEEYFRMYSPSESIANRKIIQLHRRLNAFAVSNRERSKLNRYFYQQLTGISIQKMLQASELWFQKNREGIFNPKIVRALNDHKKNRATIIVVTGSFYECIQPILNNLDIEHAVCAQLQQVNGHYTGEMLSEPTIGEGKANALRAYLNEKNLSLEGSFAYGDHETDISMLSLAHHPVVVGNNPILVSHGQQHGWSYI